MKRHPEPRVGSPARRRPRRPAAKVIISREYPPITPESLIATAERLLPHLLRINPPIDSFAEEEHYEEDQKP